MTQLRRGGLSLLLTLCILTTACGGNFASQLRSVLAGSGPLIDSLVESGVIRADQRATYIRDFTDLADGAASLKENLDACADSDKPCKLGAVEIFQQAFWDIQRRGHFGTSPKLRQVESILKVIVLAAKAYYTPAPRSRRVGGAAPVDQEALIKAKIAELKAVMHTR